MATTKKGKNQSEFEILLTLYLLALVASLSVQLYTDEEIINDKRLRLKYVIGDLVLKAVYQKVKKVD